MKRVLTFILNWSIIIAAPLWIPLTFWFYVATDSFWAEVRSGKEGIWE